MSDRAGVYCIRNKVNGKRYIGSSKHLADRLLEHLFHLENHIHSNKSLQKAFDTAGLEFCIIEFIENPNDRELIFECEQKWIDYYNSTNPKYGYNKINSQKEQSNVWWSL